MAAVHWPSLTHPGRVPKEGDVPDAGKAKKDLRGGQGDNDRGVESGDGQKGR